VAPAQAFYSLRSDSYNESQDPTGDLRVGQTLYCRAQWLEVANDVVNGVYMTGLVTCHPTLGQLFGMVSLRH
jgi:hypothetical protein